MCLMVSGDGCDDGGGVCLFICYLAGWPSQVTSVTMVDVSVYLFGTWRVAQSGDVSDDGGGVCLFICYLAEWPNQVTSVTMVEVSVYLFVTLPSGPIR